MIPKRLSNQEIESIARRVIERHFAGTPTATRPLRIAERESRDEELYIEVEVLHGANEDYIEPSATVSAGGELARSVFGAGDDRFALLMHRISDAPEKAA
jgi:hypothetical protein